MLTKYFCELQMKQFPEKTPVSIFRTYNPVIGSTNLFDFEAIESCGKKLLLAKWNEEPMDKVQELFVNQLEYKRGIIKGWDNSDNYFRGRIIIVDYDATVIDGASEWESDGFFDLYDLPPIDTWVFLAPNKDGRIDLYAWIPEQYNDLTKNAIEVNCLNLIKWLE